MQTPESRIEHAGHGSWMLDSRPWILVHRTLDPGPSVQDTVSSLLGPGSYALDTGSRTLDLDPGCWILDPGFRSRMLDPRS